MNSALRLATCTVASVLVSLSAASAATTTRCGARASEVYARDHAAIVYGLQQGASDSATGTPIPTVYACAYAARRVLRLGNLTSGSTLGGSNIRLFRLAGPFVAYVSEFESVTGDDAFYVIEKRLSDGKTIVHEPNGVITAPPCCTAAGSVGYGPTSSLVLATDGALGWLAFEQSLGPLTPADAVVTNYDGDIIYPVDDGTQMLTCELSVYGFDKRGLHLLDEGTPLAPGLEWTPFDGQVRAFAVRGRLWS
jgi:hypothetical protein